LTGIGSVFPHFKIIYRIKDFVEIILTFPKVFAKYVWPFNRSHR